MLGRRRKLNHRGSTVVYLIPVLLLFLYLLYSQILTTSPPSLRLQTSTPCASHTHSPELKFLFYAPHSGFSNQLSEFKNAALLSSLLNRTLVVPPVLDHHALALGSCPKFRVLPSRDIRLSVWESSLLLLRDNRYVSMADIVDVSPLVSSSTIRTIDFRVFASWWCGVKIEMVCSSQSTSLEPSVFNRLKECGSFLAGFGGNVDGCLYAIDKDCRNTVWTYGEDEEDGKLDSFQPDEQLKKKKNISFVRTRRDVFKTLGPGSEADRARILAFGSLFTAPYKGSQLYIDINKSSKDTRLQKLLEDTDFLPFAPQIVNAGKQFALNTIKVPFLCAQLRLLDGQFKNHWRATFSSLKEQIKSLRQGASSRTINIFVMTDLPEGNWSTTYLGELMRDKNNYRLHFLREGDDLVHDTGRELAAAGNGYRLGITPNGIRGLEEIKMNCSPQRLPDVLLYIEEVICSCASLGFVGTAGSTIADSIDLMRRQKICSS
ncbi:hypothetical protein MLD38_018386 [Melastoma candidum]|uniref:Uncharacterized protein n=1 Tax=Melastoma candidum TaxID=119954 RepID=A0ACB9QUR3_9MYRT|nr:hypothetical protein MLD38_018386 [Melastoma candidum]